MSEADAGLFFQVFFNKLPVAVVIPNLPALGAHGEKAGQDRNRSSWAAHYRRGAGLVFFGSEDPGPFLLPEQHRRYNGDLQEIPVAAEPGPGCL